MHTFACMTYCQWKDSLAQYLQLLQENKQFDITK